MLTVTEQINNSREIIRLLTQHHNTLSIRLGAIRSADDRKDMQEDMGACKRHIEALRNGIKAAEADRKGVKPGAGNGAAMANDPQNIGVVKNNPACGCKDCAYNMAHFGKLMPGHPLTDNAKYFESDKFKNTFEGLDSHG